MLSITPTKLADYLTCPLKFKFRHIDKSGSFIASAAFSFGTSMHKALQELHESRITPEDCLEAGKLLERSWDKSAYKSPEEERNYFAKGCRALETYCRLALGSNERTLGTEVYISYIIRFKDLRFRVGCKVDRIALQPDESLEIIDYKTNRSGKVMTREAARTDLPTFLYYALTRLGYPEYKNIRITYLNVLTMAKVSVKYERAEFDAHKKSLRECLSALAGGEFPPEASEACAWCDYQDECPKFGKEIDFSKFEF